MFLVFASLSGDFNHLVDGGECSRVRDDIDGMLDAGRGPFQIRGT